MIFLALALASPTDDGLKQALAKYPKGPLAEGCFQIRLDASPEPIRACLGDAKGELIIRLFLEQQDYRNTNLGVQVKRP